MSAGGCRNFAAAGGRLPSGAADGTEIESRDIQNGDVILWNASARNVCFSLLGWIQQRWCRRTNWKAAGFYSQIYSEMWKAHWFLISPAFKERDSGYLPFVMSQRAGGQSPLLGYGERLQLIFGWPNTWTVQLNISLSRKQQQKKKNSFLAQGSKHAVFCYFKDDNILNIFLQSMFQGWKCFYGSLQNFPLKNLHGKEISKPHTAKTDQQLFLFLFPFSANMLFAHQSRCLPRLLPLLAEAPPTAQTLIDPDGQTPAAVIEFLLVLKNRLRPASAPTILSEKVP